MQPDTPSPPGEPTSTQAHDEASSSSKRPRPSSRSSPGLDASDVHAQAPGQRTLNPTTGRRGSSRTTSEMHRSSTPPDASGSVKLTRTGRVSKANKGQRVHHCDECGKTYTRAEHLRRHQQNHKPGGFPCDWLSCGLSFHREDLLIRHKARHNDPHNPPSRRHSVESQNSPPDGGMPSGSTQAPGPLHVPTSDPQLITPETQPGASDNETPPSTTSARTPKRMIPPNELAPGRIPLTADGPNGDVGFRRVTNFNNPWTTSPRISPEGIDHGYESPDDLAPPPYHQSETVRGRYSSDDSFFGYSQPQTRSPGSTASPTTLHPWPTSEAQRDSVTADSYINQPSVFADSYVNAMNMLAVNRDIMEQNTIAMPSGFLDTTSLDDPTDGGAIPNYNFHLKAYWTWIHELFPVIHQQSYSHKTASPLLRTAILALGGQALGDRTAVLNARVLHDKCLKALKNRTMQNTHTFRVCDMQGIVLVEVYSIFKSRRTPLQFSQPFENVFRYLLSDLEVTHSMAPEFSGHSDNVVDFRLHKIDVACKQRLLLACYVLEQHHNIFFGRNSVTCYSDIGIDLPFPAEQQQWDTAYDYEMQSSQSPPFVQLCDALSALSSATDPSQRPYDMFRSTLIQTRLCDTAGESTESSVPDFPPIPAFEQSPRGKLAYHTFILCKTTPIRDLLAVAGESWILSEKLDSQAEFTAAQKAVRAWAMESVTRTTTQTRIHHATQHALEILKIHQQSPKTGLLFQEWSYYLAAIVVWAKSYVIRSEGRQPRLVIPNPNEPSVSGHELEQTIARIVRAGPTAPIGWPESRSVLLWTKGKIERVNVPHSCGLTSSALDVLGKLSVRGDENEWC